MFSQTPLYKLLTSSKHRCQFTKSGIGLTCLFEKGKPQLVSREFPVMGKLFSRRSQKFPLWSKSAKWSSSSENKLGSRWIFLDPDGHVLFLAKLLKLNERMTASIWEKPHSLPDPRSFSKSIFSKSEKLLDSSIPCMFQWVFVCLLASSSFTRVLGCVCSNTTGDVWSIASFTDEHLHPKKPRCVMNNRCVLFSRIFPSSSLNKAVHTHQTVFNWATNYLIQTIKAAHIYWGELRQWIWAFRVREEVRRHAEWGTVFGYVG